MGTISANAMVGRPPSGLAALVALLFTGCSPDIVSNHYDTLADARAAGLFAKGWLPEILPESSTGIRSSNDLDLNISTGRFRMSPADFAGFAAHSCEGAPSQSPIGNWDKVIVGYASDGLLPWTFRDGSDTWVFFCDAHSGSCQYVSW